MNQELDNYIKQARVSGQTDEQVRQALTSQGWTPADIDQALGVIQTSSVTPVAGTFISGKAIAAIVVAILILGAGGYFVFSKSRTLPTPTNQTSNTNNSSVTPQQNTFSASVPFHCIDLLTINDLQTIIKKDLSQYKIQEFDNTYGLLTCESSSSPWLFFTINKPSSGERSVEDFWKSLKTAYSSPPDSNLNPNAYKYTNVSGIGSDAFNQDMLDELHVLSSNKKYIIVIDNFTLDQREQMAKIIDNNLNKY